MPDYTPLRAIKDASRELGLTYEQFAERVQEQTKGTSLEGSPGAPFLAQLVCGDKRPSPEMADAIAKASGGRIRREDLIWPEDADKAVNEGTKRVSR
ncbi:MAG: hypothetical protein A2Z40_04265 [Deltaproteobacteria bacterium RBG_19FT_COMBO_60_16]|nr:MAG: hypothetical protein A2Z40_04265 [Deltaproteobacteria bacterium RBG_19FT_COMBO_60_16]